MKHCGNESCKGGNCPNWEKCRGESVPPWSWAEWYFRTFGGKETKQ